MMSEAQSVQPAEEPKTDDEKEDAVAKDSYEDDRGNIFFLGTA